MVHPKNIFISLIILFYGSIIFGQDYTVKFKHFTADDGLSQSWIQTIYQDKYGFIWIGTDNGLNRFDGTDFIVYKHSPQKPTSINSSDIRIIFEDSKGILWIGTNNGLDFYDRQKDCFKRFPKYIQQSSISAIAEDSDGNLWIGSHLNLYVYNRNKDSLINCNTEQSDVITNIFISAVFIDSNQNVWIGTNRGLRVFDKVKNMYRSFIHDVKDTKSIGGNRIVSICEDTYGRIWLGTENGLDLFLKTKDKSGNGSFLHYTYSPSNSNGISQGTVLSLLIDRDKKLWVGTENGGLDVLDVSKQNSIPDKFIHHRNDPYEPSSLTNNSIYALYQDNNENIWIGTFAKGVNIYSRLFNQFSHIKKKLDMKNSIISNFINVIFEEDEFLWIGTDLGLNQINKSSGKIKNFVHDPFNQQTISANAVYSIVKDSKGTLWIGTWAGGINKFDYTTGTFKRYLNDPENSTSIPSNNIFAIHEDKGHNFWMGSMNNGLILFDRDKELFYNYTSQNSGILSNYVSSILQANSSDLWVVTVVSLERFGTGRKSVKRYTHIPYSSSSLSSNKIFTIYKDSNGKLWVGTDIGINVLDETTGKFTCFTENDGLPDNSVRSILEDGHGNLWLGTNKGISKFIDALKYPVHPKFRNFTPDDGLQSFEFNKRACFKNKDGFFYFGGTNGLNYFHPDSIKYDLRKHNLYITELRIFNNKVEISEDSPLQKSIYLENEIKLSYKHSMFSLRYASLNYISPLKTEYAYKLEGFENDWNYVKNKKEATFTNLSPGKYTFRVKATSGDGDWDNNETSLRIIILPPWWATWWAKLMFGLLILISLLTVYYIRLYNYHLREKELIILVQRRTQELEESNRLLVEGKQQIEEQAAALFAQTENLKETNELLLEKQKYIHDQTQILEETNQQLSILNATKDKFFSIIAHDLRNPFHTVLGFSELLMTKFNVLTPEKIQKYIQLIHTASANGNNLLENLLHWSKSQTGKVSFEPEVVDLSDIVKQTLNFLKIDIQRKNLQVFNNIEAITFVYVDPNMILTVFRNLLSNAIKFTFENGTININAKEQDGELEVSVEDTGIGISEENIKLLFDFNSNYTTSGTNQEHGTGLGLILCKEFVERHNGKIWVESKSNKGSKFKFTLPINRN